MPKGERAVKNGHNSERDSKVVIHCRMPSDVNRLLGRIHEAHKPERFKKTSFRSDKQEAVFLIRMPEEVNQHLMALLAARIQKTGKQISKNAMIVEIVRARASEICDKLDRNRGKAAMRRLLDSGNTDCYTSTPGDRPSRNAMIVRMILDTTADSL